MLHKALNCLYHMVKHMGQEVFMQYYDDDDDENSKSGQI